MRFELEDDQRTTADTKRSASPARIPNTVEPLRNVVSFGSVPFMNERRLSNVRQRRCVEGYRNNLNAPTSRAAVVTEHKSPKTML